MSEIDRNTVRGGKTVYGAAVGILVLETKFPRMPGDIGYAPTWPSPVLYRVVRGASGEQVMTATPDDHPTGLLEAFLKAGADLVAEGADGLTTTCGFLSIYPKELAAHCGAPVAGSSLMQIPLVKRLLPPGKRVGVLAGGEDLVTRHDNIGTVVLECTNMVPSTRALNKRLGLPVYNIYAFVNWLHAGLNPRGFNLPGDPL